MFSCHSKWTWNYSGVEYFISISCLSLSLSLSLSLFLSSINFLYLFLFLFIFSSFRWKPTARTYRTLSILCFFLHAFVPFKISSLHTFSLWVIFFSTKIPERIFFIKYSLKNTFFLFFSGFLPLSLYSLTSKAVKSKSKASQKKFLFSREYSRWSGEREERKFCVLDWMFYFLSTIWTFTNIFRLQL